MRKKMKRTLAILLALAMMLGDNAVVFATESTETAVEAAETVETAEDANEVKDASAETGAVESEAADTQAEEAGSGGEDSGTEVPGAEDADATEETGAAATEATEETVTQETPLLAETAENTIVTVTATSDSGGDSSTVEYASFAEAFAAVNDDTTDYDNFTFTFSGDVTLDGDYQLTRELYQLTFTADEPCSLDFAGHTISSNYAVDFTFGADLTLKNSDEDTNGALYFPTECTFEIQVSGSAAGKEVTRIDGVDITADYIELSADSSQGSYIVNGNISATELIVNSGNWVFGDVAADTLAVEDINSTVTMGALSVVAYRSSNSWTNYGTLIVDGLAYPDGANVTLGTGSTLVIKTMGAHLEDIHLQKNENSDSSLVNIYVGWDETSSLYLHGDLTRDEDVVLNLGSLDLDYDGNLQWDEEGKLALQSIPAGLTLAYVAGADPDVESSTVPTED